MLKKIVKNFLISLVSLSLLIFLISRISLEAFKKSVEKFSVTEIFLIVFIFFITTIVRGIRIRFTMKKKKKDTLIFCSFSAIHTLLNHVVPFRMGEVSLPILINKYTTENIATGALSLVIIRLYDLIMLIFFFLMSVSFSVGTTGNEIHSSFIIFICILFIASIFVTIFLTELINFSGRIILKILSRSGQKKSAIGLKAESYLDDLKNKLSFWSGIDKYCILPLTSFFIWLTTYVMFYFVMRSMDIKLSFMENILASSAAVVTNFLPVNGLGSFGTLEAGWTAGYMFLGVDMDDAIISGFIMHLIVAAVGSILALASIVYLKNHKIR